MNTATPPFPSYVSLLQTFLAHRKAIVTAIDKMLNCQKKSFEYQQDLALQSPLFMECFLALPALAPEQLTLPKDLEKARWDDGLTPRDNPGNDIVDPVQMLLRAFYLWQQTRWPGQKGRLRYAHTLFILSFIRSLTLLTLRLWDEESDNIDSRLSQLQALLDQLWQQSPSDQPQLVRDVRWLMPVALSPTTDDLTGYFDFATRIANTFSEENRMETQRAWVQTGAGHLCSQLRHLCVQRAVSIDEPDLVSLTRLSNALDISLIMEGLVTLFKAYDHALHTDNTQQRLALAAAICHGVSPDPELFLLRLDLLAPYSMIEHLFISTDATGQVEYTTAGLRHLGLLGEYASLLERLSQSLSDDSQQCRPRQGGYSPYGVLFGFSSNLLELMAFKTLQFEPTPPYSLEDIFTEGDAGKLAWVNNWRKLPHVTPEASKQFEYPEDFVQTLHVRVEQAFQAYGPNTGSKHGKLFVLPDCVEQTDAALAQIPALPSRYIVSSDPQEVETHKAAFQDEEDLRHCRIEGEFLVSYKTSQGWVGISKNSLTEVLGGGDDVTITGLPNEAAQVLRLMCPKLVVLASNSEE